MTRMVAGPSGVRDVRHTAPDGSTRKAGSPVPRRCTPRVRARSSWNGACQRPVSMTSVCGCVGPSPAGAAPPRGTRGLTRPWRSGPTSGRGPPPATPACLHVVRSRWPRSHPSPMTAPSSTTDSPIRAPRAEHPGADLRARADPHAVEQHAAVDPGARPDHRARARPPCRRRHRAPGPTCAPSSSSASPGTPHRGTAGEASRPSTRSQEPRTNASGVPTSSQYERVQVAHHHRITGSISAGKVSRSTETTRPGGISSMTSRRNT